MDTIPKDKVNRYELGMVLGRIIVLYVPSRCVEEVNTNPPAVDERTSRTLQKLDSLYSRLARGCLASGTVKLFAGPHSTFS
jgi:hypothetical protein